MHRQHHRGANSVRWLHAGGSIVTSSRHTHWTQLSPKSPCPQCKKPILCAMACSTKNGAAGSDFGRNQTRRHPGDKATRSCVQTDASICGHLPRCRHWRSWGLERRCFLGVGHLPQRLRPCRCWVSHALLYRRRPARALSNFPGWMQPPFISVTPGACQGSCRLIHAALS